MLAPAFASAQRPAFRAGAGYAGSRAVLSLGHDFGADLLLGAFVRRDDLGGAAFADSPLLRQRESWMAGLALTWTFVRSEERVRHEVEDDRMPGSID